MKNSILPILFSALMILAAACTRETDVASLGPKAVVESYLMAGDTVQVKISEESITGTVDSLIPIGGLSVYIISNGVTYPLADAGNGIYTNELLIAQAGLTYDLHFEYNGQLITATTKVPDMPAGFTGSATTITAPTPGIGGTLPDPVVYTWNNPNNEYHLLLVRCIETDPVEIGSGAILIGAGTFRTEPTQASVQHITPMRFRYYGLHEVTLYRILPEYAALYEDNGNNSTNLTTPPGNIVNGLGIFTGVNFSDKLYITVQ